ncbi:LytTR family DNA-binding domain-containing protein [Phenylobacterium terrae]|uniref:LytTR family DNA-binding domain-containing protein n=1 Tax=Phenylobacterium terrae TaxID=2665495 RepID=A0ABW4MWM9_9CAUL
MTPAEAIGDRRVWVRDIAFTAVAALTIAVMGPYGSYDAPLEERIVRSFAYGFSGLLILWPPMRLALRAGARAGLPDLFVMVAGLSLLAVPVSAVTWLVGRLFEADPVSSGLQRYFAVLAMVLPVGVGYLFVDRWLEREERPPVRPEPAPPRLLARLPGRLGREVLALQAEDHYVRVHTKAGSTLILMRLADAIAELDGLEGERVHRSWWVARSAVASARPDGRRMTLTLANGVEAPVTRDAVPRLRRAGWI